MKTTEQAERRAYLLRDLTHVVQAHSGHGWETIAGFNVKSIAAQYAAECRASAKRRGMPHRYQIRKA